VLSENTVEPSLGADTIQSGYHAAIIGTIAVAGFMLVYYMFAGLIRQRRPDVQYHHPHGPVVRRSAPR